jgi:hypothetical protein
MPRLLPDLIGINPNLPREQDRLTAWYYVVYITFFFCVLPIYIFVTALRQHHAGKSAQCTPATAICGLVITGLTVVLVFFALVDIFHVLPLYR